MTVGRNHGPRASGFRRSAPRCFRCPPLRPGLCLRFMSETSGRRWPVLAAGFAALATSASWSQVVAGASAVVPFASAHPAWAAALGPGVTVLAPAPVTAGWSTPGAPVVGFVRAEPTRSPAKLCHYIALPPPYQGKCVAIVGQALGGYQTMKNFAIGYVAIHGTEALVGTTYSACFLQGTPKCVTNTNPAAIFSSRKTFKVLWAETLVSSNSPSNVYTLANCKRIGSKWYVYFGI